ncbi:MAG: TonB-dependent receptor domain-containing protein [Acidobacteriota bacterium]
MATFDLFNVNVTPVVSRLGNTDFLPSLSAIYKINGSMNLRGAYSRTLNRPEFRELAPFDFTDVVGGRSIIGTPDLVRARIQNYDARWEWFVSAAELVAVSYFFKSFKDPIERVVEPTAALRTSFRNAQGARNQGVEMEVRKHLGRGFLIASNYTFVDSEIELRPEALNVATSKKRPLAGQSRHLFNGIVEYRHSGSGPLTRLLFNYIGSRIADVGAFGLPDILEDGYPQLDFLVNVPLGESGWALKFSAENLLDREKRFSQGGLPHRVFRDGRTFKAGLAMSFF